MVRRTCVAVFADTCCFLVILFDFEFNCQIAVI
jgi:hypothetical protein